MKLLKTDRIKDYFTPATTSSTTTTRQAGHISLNNKKIR